MSVKIEKIDISVLLPEYAIKHFESNFEEEFGKLGIPYNMAAILYCIGYQGCLAHVKEHGLARVLADYLSLREQDKHREE